MFRWIRLVTFCWTTISVIIMITLSNRLHLELSRNHATFRHSEFFPVAGIGYAHLVVFTCEIAPLRPMRWSAAWNIRWTSDRQFASYLHISAVDRWLQLQPRTVPLKYWMNRSFVVYVRRSDQCVGEYYREKIIIDRKTRLSFFLVRGRAKQYRRFVGFATNFITGQTLAFLSTD